MCLQWGRGLLTEYTHKELGQGGGRLKNGKVVGLWNQRLEMLPIPPGCVTQATA